MCVCVCVFPWPFTKHGGRGGGGTGGGVSCSHSSVQIALRLKLTMRRNGITALNALSGRLTGDGASDTPPSSPPPTTGSTPHQPGLHTDARRKGHKPEPTGCERVLKRAAALPPGLARRVKGGFVCSAPPEATGSLKDTTERGNGKKVPQLNGSADHSMRLSSNLNVKEGPGPRGAR